MARTEIAVGQHLVAIDDIEAGKRLKIIKRDVQGRNTAAVSIDLDDAAQDAIGAALDTVEENA